MLSLTGWWYSVGRASFYRTIISMPAIRTAVICHSSRPAALSAAAAIAGSLRSLLRQAVTLLAAGAILGTQQTSRAGAAPAAIVPGVPAQWIGAAGGLLVLIALLAFLLFRLQRQKALLDALFEQTPLAISLTAPDDRIIRISTDFTRIFGYTRQNAIGRRLSELIVPAESQDEHRKHADLAARGQRVDAEGVRCRQDGSRFPVAITNAPFSVPGQQGAVYAIYRDIADRRQAEEAGRASEGRWHAIFDNSAVGIALVDAYGKFSAANRAYREMLGYAEEELQAITFIDLTLEEDRPANALFFKEIWTGQLPRFTIEKRMRRKDGLTIWVRVTVSIVPGTTPPISVGVVEDITERKRAEARLLEYEKVVEGLQEMIAVVDREYRYLIANRAFSEYRGMQPDLVVGHFVPRVLGQERFERFVKSKMDDCFQGRIVKYEVEFKHSKLGQRVIAASYFPIEGPTGVDRIAVVLRDITEQKRSERELQRSFAEMHALNAQLQSVREEERTSLARELHDRLGQALTAIKIDLAAVKTTPRPEQQVRGIDSILRLVDETIQSVRRIATELRPAILDDLGLVAAVEWAAEEFQARTGIRCQVSLPETIPAMDNERATALFRILQETLTNIARHAGATQVRIGLTQDPGYVSLEVRDNGRGIGDEQLSAAGSLGILGMRERARLLGGEFFIGDPGGGTVVRVRIPCADIPQAKYNQ